MNLKSPTVLLSVIRRGAVSPCVIRGRTVCNAHATRGKTAHRICCRVEHDAKRWIAGLIGGFVLLASSLLACQEAAATQPPSSPRRRPNVVMIVIDDQNDWIGCLNGHPQARTPHSMDTLA